MSEPGQGGRLARGVVAVVLAGGFGTRVRELLPGIPKPMATVCGRPFLEWVVRYLIKQGLENLVLSTGYLSKVVQKHFENRPIGGVLVRTVAEGKPLGTAGGFLNAARGSGISARAWLVLNGDSLAFAEVARLAEHLEDPSIAGVLVGRRVPDAARYGTLTTDNSGELLGFQEKRPGSGLISAGIYLFRNSTIAEFPTTEPLSFEMEMFPGLVKRGFRIKVHPLDVPFLDIGTPETLRQAQSFIEQNRIQFYEDGTSGI